MGLLDLSYITSALTALIQNAVNASTGWTGANGVTVSPQPPDLIKGSSNSNVLGFYLYHVSEDPHFKNLPSPGVDTPPIRHAPMGLILHYQLTAHSDETDSGTLLEQTMMGLALKALHDYPVIDDSTTVNGSKIVDSTKGLGLPIRIAIMPLPYNEAVSYWTAGSVPMRLAAYYEVSVVLLEPEEVERRVGRVLTYGVYPFLQGAPRLLTSRNTVSFLLPGETAPRTVDLQPAEVTYDQQVAFQGVNLTAKNTRLLLKRSDWDQFAEVDAAWAVAPSSDKVVATVRDTITQQAPLSTLTVLPGVYSAQVKVVDERVTSDGTWRRFEKLSNATPFTIAPMVQSLTTPDSNGEFTITGRVFQDPGLSPDRIEIYIADSRLKLGTSAPLNPGEFSITDATTLQVCLPPNLATGTRLPFRLLINSAESAPQWVVVP